jgi:hypothetical protein
MFRVYNSFALNSKQRFLRACLFGIPTAIGLGIVYGIISRILPITFSIVYVGIGYLIGYVIRKFGRGVQPKFSYLAAGLAVLSFILSDVIRYFGLNLGYDLFGQILAIVSQVYLGSINGLINLAFIAWGVIMAFNTARIV